MALQYINDDDPTSLTAAANAQDRALAKYTPLGAKTVYRSLVTLTPAQVTALFSYGAGAATPYLLVAPIANAVIIVRSAHIWLHATPANNGFNNATAGLQPNWTGSLAVQAGAAGAALGAGAGALIIGYTNTTNALTTAAIVVAHPTITFTAGFGQTNAVDYTFRNSALTGAVPADTPVGMGVYIAKATADYGACNGNNKFTILVEYEIHQLV